MKTMTSLILITLLFSTTVNAGNIPIKFNCEEDSTVCWEIPGWSLNDTDYVGVESMVSTDMSTEGEKSLKVMCNFPGDVWAAVMIECSRNIDLTGYKKMSADIYLPENAVSGFIEARFIITAGNWHFIETKKAKELKPGKWVHLTAKIGGKKFRDDRYWKCQSDETCIIANIDDIKVLGIRIEYNANERYAGPPYNGPIYIDNIVIE